MSLSKGPAITSEYAAKKSIARLLLDAAERKNEKGIRYLHIDGSNKFLSYEALAGRALNCLGGLQEHGMKPGRHLLLVVNDSIDFIVGFWACILGGFIPVPMTYPGSVSLKDAVFQKLLKIWGLLDKPPILTEHKFLEERRKISELLDEKKIDMLAISDLLNSNFSGKINFSKSDSPAFIQFTSGSTNSPKGVILSHNNILINIESIITGAGLTCEDSTFSWMPFYHDLGLIGFHLVPTALEMNQAHMSPIKFIQYPHLWIEYISQLNSTLTCSPNFGYRLLLEKSETEQLKKYHLGSLRLIFNGGEPISASLMNEFVEKLSVCGLSRSSMYPVYGMAEACVAVSFPPPGSIPLVRCLDSKKIADNLNVELCDNSISGIYRVDLGYPMPGMEIRIVNKQGEIVPEKAIGEIQINGKNVTSGYINNPEATGEAFQEGWFKTGDTGFMIDGRLTITGRLKDLIMINGQNYFAHDIESYLEESAGIEVGKVVVGAWYDEKECRDVIALFSALHISKYNLKSFYAYILSKINETFGFPVDYLVIVQSIPKTASGKIERYSLVQSFQKNEFIDNTFHTKDLLIDSQAYSYSQHEPEPLMSELTDQIRSIWAATLGLPVNSVPFDQSFLSLGGNSLKAVQMLSNLEEKLGRHISYDILTKCQTINDATQFCTKNEIPQILPSYTSSVKTASPSLDDIAVISMACRLPGADTPEEYWNNILMRRCFIDEVPAERWDKSHFYSPTPTPGMTYCKSGGFLKDPYAFDANFFNISEEEVTFIDPQQRLILELALETIENAGYSKHELDGKNAGVFIGASNSSYMEQLFLNMSEFISGKLQDFSNLTESQKNEFAKRFSQGYGFNKYHPQMLVGNILNMIAARVSHEFNFKGPSLVNDTACSSSLVSIHLASESLRKGECQIALAGGINLLLTPMPYILLCEAGAISHQGIPRGFDEKADGLVLGEGTGMVMLKMLKKAREDNDNVLAIIKASAVNNDGRSVGTMAPNPDGQKEVIESLYRENGLSPRDIQYVETHGTGTRLGDYSELRALTSAFEAWKLPFGSIPIGTVKSNIGHLLCAAGISSFIKLVLALHNKKLPPIINLSLPNSLLNIEETPFYFVDRAKDWKVESGKPRRGAINAFGFGGTNCHMVLEEESSGKTKEKASAEWPEYLLCLAAHTKNALQSKADNLAQFLKLHPEYTLSDVCYSENIRCGNFPYRTSILVKTAAELIDKLQSPIQTSSVQNVPKVAFLFDCQAIIPFDSADELSENLPYFKNYLDECAEAFNPYLNKNLNELFRGKNIKECLETQPDLIHPAAFALNYALAKSLLEIGATPDYIVGYSLGDWLAACLAGAVTLCDAARNISVIGRKLAQMEPVGALSIFAPARQINIILQEFREELWISAYNGTHQVVSGKTTSIDKLILLLSERSVPFKRLPANGALHTPLMDKYLNDYKNDISSNPSAKTNSIAVYSLSGGPAENFDAQFWISHCAEPINFAQCTKYLANNDVSVFVEFGSDKMLSEIITGTMPYDNKKVLSPFPGGRKNLFEAFLETLSGLYNSGVSINWKFYGKQFSSKRVDLPPYPFENKTYKNNIFEEVQNLNEVQTGKPNLFSEWEWQDKPLSPTNTHSVPGTIVIFNDWENLNQEWEKFFHPEVNPVFWVTHGVQFSFDGHRHFTIDMCNPFDYHKLLKMIPGKIAAILHCLNFTQPKYSPRKLLNDNLAWHKSFYSIFYLAKALVDLKLTNIRLQLVTGNAYLPGSSSGRFDNPHQFIASIIGQTVGQENSGIETIILDLDKDSFFEAREAALAIISELTEAFGQEEGIVALRDGKRFIRNLAKVGDISSRSDNRISISAGETFLITGGAGQIGGEIAKMLAKQAKINLILTGHGELPSREKWESLAADTKVKAKINLILELEQMGANIMYAAVNVSDKEQMAGLINEIQVKFGPLHGVIHAAGILDNSKFKLLDKDFNTIQNVLAPKFQGTVITDILTRNQPLKFFVTTSSVSASHKKWAVSLGDYAAANAFLDAYSYYRSLDNAPGCSLAVNFSMWEDKGMSQKMGGAGKLAVKSQGLKPLAAQQALDALWQAISFGLGPVVHVFEAVEVEAKDNLKSQLAGLWKSVLEMDNELRDAFLGDESFFALGGDSMKAIELVEKLRQMGYKVDFNDIFQCETLDELAAHISKQVVNKQKVSDISLAKGNLEKAFNVAFRIIPVSKEDTMFLVYLLRQSDRQKEADILRYVETEFSPEIFPTHIKYIEEALYNDFSFEGRDINEDLELIGGNEFWLANKFVNQIRSIDQLNQKKLFGNQIIKKYDISSIQKFHIDWAIRLMGFCLNINNVIDIELFSGAILKLIQEQSVLRTIVKSENDCITMNELEPPDELKLNFIDLIGYDPITKKKVITEIVKKCFYKEYPIFNSLNYRFILIREDLSHYKLIYTADHIISDNISIDIIKKKIFNYYNKQEPTNSDVHYEDYIKQIAKGPQGIDYPEIIRMFSLKEFKQVFDYTSAAIRNFGLKKEEPFQVYVPFEKLNNLDLDTIRDLSLAIFARMCSQIFNIRQIPISIIYHGRAYEGKKYFETLGEFVDFIPVLVTASPGNEETGIKDELSQKIRMAESHNINFVHLIERNPEIKNLLSNTFYKAPTALVFNFTGKVGAEDEIMKVATLARMNGPEKTVPEKVQMGLEFEASYTENNMIRFTIMNAFGLDLVKIKELLEEEAGKMEYIYSK